MKLSNHLLCSVVNYIHSFTENFTPISEIYFWSILGTYLHAGFQWKLLEEKTLFNIMMVKLIPLGLIW